MYRNVLEMKAQLAVQCTAQTVHCITDCVYLASYQNTVNFRLKSTACRTIYCADCTFYIASVNRLCISGWDGWAV